MKKPCLVVLAAGMGSRYGGLKQLDPVGPNGELVLDYSVRDAMAAGFEKIVFVIRRDFEKAFRDTVLARCGGAAELVFQDLDDLPPGFSVPNGREKPWGTGHAILAARNAVEGPFAVVNADDYYGPQAFQTLSGFLSTKPSSPTPMLALVAYRLANTLSENGPVSRGVCTTRAGLLAGLEEHTAIERAPDGTIRGKNAAGETLELADGTPVSMNLWGFPAGFFDLLAPLFAEFLEAGGIHEAKSEFYIPTAVNALIETQRIQACVLQTTAQWLGITYREDRASVTAALSQRP